MDRDLPTAEFPLAAPSTLDPTSAADRPPAPPTATPGPARGLRALAARNGTSGPADRPSAQTAGSDTDVGPPAEPASGDVDSGRIDARTEARPTSGQDTEELQRIPPAPPDHPPQTTCPACGDPVGADDQYCEACGAAVHTATDGQATVPRCGACGAAALDADGYCQHCGARSPRSSDRVERDLGTLAGVSDRGRRHRDNEDAMALWQGTLPDGGACAAAVVCDGVSSSDRPAEASAAAAEAAATALADAVQGGADPQTAVRSATAGAAAAVAALDDPNPPGTGPDPSPPSCTLVAALATAAGVTVAWIGDSRAYWLADPDTPGQSSVCLTEDDSWAAQMVAWGLMDWTQAAADPRAHALARWLGADATDTEPRVVTFTPSGPGAVLLCSDGLWNYLPDAAELAAAALPGARTAPLETARTLARVALDGGGRDNITVVVVPFPPASGAWKEHPQ